MSKKEDNKKAIKSSAAVDPSTTVVEEKKKTGPQILNVWTRSSAFKDTKAYVKHRNKLNHKHI